ncbi:unnamed protein product [Brugia timori]|uniref:Hyaluronidase n=1 Tax=Brugia timori TaxID=42155 RepID=A0A0R3QNX6_9BILA|nr:unnamed protein product [Brugia timori]
MTEKQTFFNENSNIKVRWNVPTHQCKNWSEIQKPEHYGILVNDEYKFYGNVVVTLYEEKFGLYPYYKNYSNLSSAVNGGIPQVNNDRCFFSLTAKIKKKKLKGLSIEMISVE